MLNLYILVPQDGTDRFNRHIVGQADFRRHRMAAHVPRKAFGNSAPFGYGIDSIQAGHVRRNGKNLVAFSKSFVFLHNLQWNIQQPDIGLHACFLAVHVNPKVVVKVGAQVFFRKVAHVRETKTREAAEQE